MLTDAQARSATECSKDQSDCRFTVSIQPSGETWVRIERATRQLETRECIHMPGDHWTLLYRPDGTFLEKHQGL